MSKAFQKTLLEAKALSPQEQLALIAALSHLLSQQSVFPGTEDAFHEDMLPAEDEAEVLRRVKNYEEGKSKTISGKAFREELKKKFGVLLKKRSVTSVFLIGLLNGFLPCGLVYIAVAGAIASGGYLDGAVYMFVFGIGTMPVMLTVSLAGNFINISIRKRIGKLIPAFMIVLAFLFILRGMNLGIPYVSPQIQHSEVVDESVICH